MVDKSRGGLGVLNLKQMNIALLVKWIWRFGLEKDKLWCKIISEKHGVMSSHWLPGIKVAFWFDKCSGADSLKLSFPNLFRLAKDKFSSVISHIKNGNSVFDFKRRLLDEEVNQFALLLLRIDSSPPPLNNLPDPRRWSLGNNGVFSIKALYSELIKLDGVSDFPYKFVWNSIIPPKVCFFVWHAVHGKLNTKDMLLRKGMSLDQECIMCGDVVETSSHFCFTGWHLLNESGNTIYWNMIPAAVGWIIWGEKNARTFGTIGMQFSHSIFMFSANV
ncbi:uncharacterized protein LOC113311399 [Papaver somniferum]|uniref:uncharacterized protein LOC113311399 n=1 Tax=Papaver somniferum TaxID=3469 RepID=UPI000E7009BB|nr:uncharacterized protein LOC113311399 [Papaver somniferum]